MILPTLSYRQRIVLKELVAKGELWRGCTNPTLCALERRALAEWESVKGRAFERWTPTAAGRSEIAG